MVVVADGVAVTIAVSVDVVSVGRLPSVVTVVLVW
jgi:hypothetical protein